MPNLRSRRASPLVFSFLAVASGALPAGAQSIVLDVGRGVIGDYVVVSRSNDRSSVCDEFINPSALSVPACTTPDRGVGDGWSAPFSDGGLLAGAGIEFDIAGPWTLAFDYGRTQANFDQTVASTNAQGVDFEKLSNEREVGRERLGAWRTHAVHGVVHLYPIERGPVRPYGGVGLGYAAMRADFGWSWRRHAAPLAIATGRGQPNFDTIRSNLAGTESGGRVEFSKRMHVFVYVGGVDFGVRDRFSVGVRFRASSTRRWRSGRTSGRLCGTHVPNLRLDGSEPVSTWSTLPVAGVTEVSMVVKYRLPRGE